MLKEGDTTPGSDIQVRLRGESLNPVVQKKLIKVRPQYPTPMRLCPETRSLEVTRGSTSTSTSSSSSSRQQQPQQQSQQAAAAGSRSRQPQQAAGFEGIHLQSILVLSSCIQKAATRLVLPAQRRNANNVGSVPYPTKGRSSNQIMAC